MKLIHKDIKPDNIMYSPYHKDYVLLDYGISCSIAEDIGQKTLTYREGTKKYMSLEMHNLKKTLLGYADLYYNDLNCLQMTLSEMRNPYYTPAMFNDIPKEECVEDNNIYKVF
jgi:serine/threonine protein kinase